MNKNDLNNFSGIEIKDLGKNNKIIIDPECNFARSKIFIQGDNNQVTIGKSLSYQDLVLNVKGNEKTFEIAPSNKNINGLKFVSIRGNNQRFSIGKNFSCGGLEVQMNDGDEECLIGDNCLFSWGIKIRTSDGHSVIDLQSGKPINYPRNVYIHDRVWIGEDVRVLKGAVIAEDSVVGSSSVVTKSFINDKSVIIGGVPAKVLRTNIRWDYKQPSKVQAQQGLSDSDSEIMFNGQDCIYENAEFLLKNKNRKLNSNQPPQLDPNLNYSPQSFSIFTTLQDIVVKEMQNGIIVGDKFYVNDKQFSFGNKELFYLSNEETVKEKLEANDRIQGDENCIYISGANIGFKNFYHWMFQCVPAIALTMALYKHQNYKVVLPPLNSFRARSIELLGLKPENYLVLENNQVLEADTVVYTNLLSGNFSFDPSPFVFEQLERLLQNSLQNSKMDHYPDKLYISRKDSPRRNLTNDDEISERLGEKGYEEIVMSDFSLEDQIALFYHAKKVVAPHGAALVNLMFAKSCESLVEIMPSNYVNDCFYKICLINKIQYKNVVAESEGEGHYHHTKSKLDLEKLMELV